MLIGCQRRGGSGDPIGDMLAFPRFPPLGAQTKAGNMVFKRSEAMLSRRNAARTGSA
jgi:hypothetical protein